MTAPVKPAAHAEQALLQGILDGAWPAHALLPPERELAGTLGVTRPTLREALQRLHRDGWVEIRHGKPTRVRDVWREGGLNVLSAVVQLGGRRRAKLVPEMLEVREALAPACAASAVAHAAGEVADLLGEAAQLDDRAAAFAAFDWRVHRALAIASGNPIQVLILNGFAGFYEAAAERYFASAVARDASRRFYRELRRAAQRSDARAARRVTAAAMKRSRTLWESR